MFNQIFPGDLVAINTTEWFDEVDYELWHPTVGPINIKLGGPIYLEKGTVLLYLASPNSWQRSHYYFLTGKGIRCRISRSKYQILKLLTKIEK